jgi:two-component system chemotaxis response regulator CheB
MKKIKLLIVDDSAFIIKVIKGMVAHEPEIEVVGVARNGKEAVEKAALLKPDIITMDIKMPIMNGLQAVQEIMADTPTAILMVSSLTKEGAKETIDALSFGAIDFITKQSVFSLEQTVEMRDEVLGKIKEIARSSMLRSRLARTQSIFDSLSRSRKNRSFGQEAPVGNPIVAGKKNEAKRVLPKAGTRAKDSIPNLPSKTSGFFKPITKASIPKPSTLPLKEKRHAPEAKTKTKAPARKPSESSAKNIIPAQEQHSFSKLLVKELHPESPDNKITGRKRPAPSYFKIVVLGVSTGGPLALHQVIPRLPTNMPVAVLIVQHMPPHFTKSLAERLDTLSQVNVCEAQDGEAIMPGNVYIAPGGLHMTVADNATKIVVSQEPSSTLHRPSVDIMVESVVAEVGGNALGVIMTGMGRDGLLGLRKLSEAEGYVIAQSEESCVVYGMPKAVVDDRIADEIKGLEELADAIAECVGVQALEPI